MKTIIKTPFDVLLIFCLLLTLTGSCKKEDDNYFGRGVTDIDGNKYKSVIIGTQEWMAENLRVTHYNNGDPITIVYDNIQWTEVTNGAYAIYPHSFIDGLNSDIEVLNAYGALYNWYAVNTSNLCPTGWHVPNDIEWTTLTNYVGGLSIAGSKLKSTRTTPETHPRWNYPNTDATDDYYFSALPGGFRSDYDGTSHNLGAQGTWWSSTEIDESFVWCRSIIYTFLDNEIMFRADGHKGDGLSVRCIKD